MSVARSSVTYPHSTLAAAAGPPMYHAGVVQAPQVYAVHTQAAPAHYAAAGFAAYPPQGAYDGGYAGGCHHAGQVCGAAQHQYVPGPQAPQRQTDGLPTPEDVSVQKQKYAQALDSQLEAGKRTIAEHTQQAKAILRQQAEEKKMAFALQVEEQLMAKEMSLDQDTHQKLMELHQAAHNQKSKLEQQASSLTLDFRQKQMLEQMEQKRYEMQMKQCDMRERMAQEKQGIMQHYDGSAVAPPQEQQQYMPQPQHHVPAVPPYPGPSPVHGGGSAQAPVGQPHYEQIPSASPHGGTPHHSQQYHSANYGEAAGGASMYGVPPTQYAPPQTTMAAPPTANASGHYSQPVTSMGAHQHGSHQQMGPPQTVLPVGH